MTQLVVICLYLVALLAVSWLATRLFEGTARDYFLASHSIGPVMLLMSIFGTTMTAFALVGATGESYRLGIGVLGMLASWSALVHTAVFFFVGIKLWSIGKRFGHLTQIQYFRDRFESDAIGLLLFPALVGLVIPYLLTGLLGAGSVVAVLTQGALPDLFPATAGGIPAWLTNLIISAVVLLYISFGGLRGAAWANTFQTIVFLVTGVTATTLIAGKLGGAQAATQAVLAAHPEKLILGDALPPLVFLAYGLIPLSVGTFPHVFQHWLTARSAKAFKLTIVGHPLFIALLWTPCVLIGVWATSAVMPDGSLVVPVDHPPNSELGLMVQKLTTPVIGGLLGAGILAAIMSSLDSQFLAISSIFTNDIVGHYVSREHIDDRQRVRLGRLFVVLIVALTFGLSLLEPRSVFALGVWCFSGFTALFPLVVAALYWKRTTSAGAMASILTAAAVWFLLFRDSNYAADPNYEFLGLMPVVTMIFAAIVALVGVSLVTAPPSAATIEKFFPAKH
jgi:SSS family solute:Na+ symporter